MLYAITDGKKIVSLDFLQYSQFLANPLPSQFSIRAFSGAETIREAEYIDRTTFFLGCSGIGRCVVVNFEDEHYS